MNTEITDIKDCDGRSVRWVGYDADCGVCVLLADWCRVSLERHGFRLVPLQTPWMLARLGVKTGGPFPEMKLIQPDGRVMGGGRAVVEIARHNWWLRPLAWLGSYPGGFTIIDRAYRWIARNRKCATGVCSTKFTGKPKRLERHRHTCSFFEMP